MTIERAVTSNDCGPAKTEEAFLLVKDERGYYTLNEVTGDRFFAALSKDEMLMILAQLLIGATNLRPFTSWASSKSAMRSKKDELRDMEKSERLFENRRLF